MAKVTEILDSLRRVISRATITSTTLTSAANTGDTVLTVDNSIRFNVGDEFIIRDANGQTEPLPAVNYVAGIIDNNHIQIANPLILNWPLMNTPSIFKSLCGQYVKDIYVSEPAVIRAFPAITVTPTRRSSDWLTLRGTVSKYNFEIGIFVEDATMEAGLRVLDELTSTVEEALKKHVFLLVNNYDVCALTADSMPGDIVFKVADSSIFQCNQRCLIEDKYTDMETMITEIIDANTIRVYSGCEYSFKVANNAVAISPKRFIHNSWPAEIDYGKINKGTLLKAAVISYFAEEYRIEFLQPWPDTEIK